MLVVLWCCWCCCSPRRHDLPGLRGAPLRPLLPSLPVLSLLLLHDGGLVGFLVHSVLQGHPLAPPPWREWPPAPPPPRYPPAFSSARPAGAGSAWLLYRAPLFFVWPSASPLRLAVASAGFSPYDPYQSINQSINQQALSLRLQHLHPFRMLFVSYLYLHLTYIPSPRRRKGRSLSWR